MALLLPSNTNSSQTLPTISSQAAPPHRKQYQSCDACRKNRRACDAVRRGVNPLLVSSQTSPDLGCSACIKAGRRCTFDWLRDLPESALPKGLKRKRESPGTNGQNSGAFQARSNHAHVASDRFEGADLFNYRPLSYQTSPPLPCDLADVSHHPVGGPAWDWMGLTEEQNYVEAPNGHPKASWRPPAAFEHQDPGMGSFLDQTLGGKNPSNRDVGMYSTGSLSYGSSNALLGTQRLMTPTYVADDASNSAGPSRPSVGTDGVHGHRESGNTQAPLSAYENALARASSKNLVSAHLAQIYHGSLENALRCWLTAENCPYRDSNRTVHASQYPWSHQAPSYLQNIRHLDRVSQNIRTTRPSAEENALASKTLSIVIMAFASQWAHGSHQVTRDVFEDGDFESLLRQSLWCEAQRYVRASARIDCFRAIFAQMIFALIQTPQLGLSYEQATPRPSSSPTQSTLTRIDDSPPHDMSPDTFPVLGTGPAKGDDERPEYLERGLRGLLEWRDRLRKWTSGQVTGGSGIMYAQDMASRRAAIEMQPAFDVLFWFGLMCDTTSSVLNDRPLVISDESCDDADCALSGSSTGSPNAKTTSIWSLASMQQQDSHRVPRNIEAVLQQGVPPKVLLWRRLGRLKSTVSQPVEPTTVEQRIEAALEVANFWKRKYSPLIRQCISRHGQLPFKVQSWYVILAAHFHLACLFVADCIKYLDRSGRTCHERRTARAASATVLNMTLDSACTIADLASVSVSPPTAADGGRKSPFAADGEFHDAINSTALLSEPWTDVLVEALSKAFETMLNWLALRNSRLASSDEASELAWITAYTNTEELEKSCTSCITGVELLGRKSDIAIVRSRKMKSQLAALTHPSLPR